MIIWLGSMTWLAIAQHDIRLVRFVMIVASLWTVVQVLMRLAQRPSGSVSVHPGADAKHSTSFVGMWRISIQDLRHRRRRFVLAVVATGLAFGMSLLMQGFVTTLGWESRHIVGLFGADEWVVAAGGTGPFTTMTFIDASVVDEFRTQPGVRAAGAFVQARRSCMASIRSSSGSSPVVSVCLSQRTGGRRQPRAR